MNSDSSEAFTVIELLRDFRDRLWGFITFIADKRHLTQHEKSDARERLTNLKSDFKQLQKQWSTAAGESELNDIELRYLRPAVNQANSRLRAAINTNPITSRWASELSAAHGDVVYFLRQLESQYPSASQDGS